MTWALLFTLTLLAVLWPMLPALAEWYRPTDVAPLQIDTLDTLDPPCLARSFASRLAAALSAGQAQLGRSPIAQALSVGPWPLDAKELSRGASLRVWQTAGDALLPSAVRFLAEVSAQGSLRTAVGGVYRALWAGRHLHLAPDSTLLRWAHGAQVQVSSGCRLAGRVSADDSITVGVGTSFTLLHAPTVRFLPAPSDKPAPKTSLSSIGLPEAVVWNVAAARGTCEDALEVAAHCAWRGDLVCRGTVSLGLGCNAHGSVKTQGDLMLGAGSNITGSAFAQGRITLCAGCRVRGALVSERAIVIGSDCVIGAPGYPASVAAPSIQVDPGVVVYGTLWAGASGSTSAAPAMAQSADAQASERPDALAREANA